MKISKLISSSLIIATFMIILTACGRTPPNVLPPLPTEPNNIELPRPGSQDVPTFDLELEGTISSPKILTHEYEGKLIAGKKTLLTKKLILFLTPLLHAEVVSPSSSNDDNVIAKIKCQLSCSDNGRCLHLQFLSQDGRFIDICKTEVDQNNNYNFKIQNSSLLDQKILRLTFPNFKNGHRQIIFKFDHKDLNREKKFQRHIDSEDTLKSSLYFYDILHLGHLFDFSLMQTNSEELIKTNIRNTCQNLSEGQIDFIYHQHFETIMSDDHLFTLTQFRLIPSTDVNSFCQQLAYLSDTINAGDNDNNQESNDNQNSTLPILDISKTSLIVKHSGLRTRLLLCLNVFNKQETTKCTPRYPIHYIIGIQTFSKTKCVSSGEQKNYGLTAEGELWVKNGCQGLFHYISLDFEQRSPLAISTFKGKSLEPDTLFIQHKAALTANDQPLVKINNELCAPVVRISDNLFKCQLPELDTGAYPVVIETNRYRYLLHEKFFIKSYD